LQGPAGAGGFGHLVEHPPVIFIPAVVAVAIVME
jgi:hypothetical protein